MAKRPALEYMPGGYDKYTQSLSKILLFVQQHNLSREQLKQWLRGSDFNLTSNAVINRTIGIIQNLELVTVSDDRFKVTDTGAQFIRTRDNDLIYEKLNANYLGIEDIMQILAAGSCSIDSIHETLKKKLNVKWETVTQVQIRLNWLCGLGRVTKIGKEYALRQPDIPSKDEAEVKRPTHQEIQDMIVEIGRIRGLETKKEYRFNEEYIDVLWQKHKQSVAWEVHFEGNVHQALSKLERALEWIPAEPHLVTATEGESEAKELLQTGFEKLEGVIKIAHWNDIIKWYKSVRPSTEIPEKLGFRSPIYLRERKHRR